MTTSEIDVALMRKMLEHVTNHPEEHDQGQWGVASEACGTRMCAAGWAVTLAGYRTHWIRSGYDHHAAVRIIDSAQLPSGQIVTVPDAAMHALGLNHSQANRMFYRAQCAADLWELAHEYTDGEITIPDDLPDGS